MSRSMQLHYIPVTTGTGNPNKAWKTVNDILGRKQRAYDVGEIKINDHSVTSPEQIAEKFNDYFTSIGRCPAENIDNSECNDRESIC